MDGEPGEEQGDLARDGDAGALGHHEREDPERSELLDDAGHGRAHGPKPFRPSEVPGAVRLGLSLVARRAADDERFLLDDA